MKKIVAPNLSFVLLALLIFGAGSVFSQGINLTTTTTPSICYNDGTIAARATGGVSPYHYSIIGGPIHPNLTYPIVLPVGNDTFIDLPHGTFTLVVVDAASHRDTFTATVGGTYQFPSLTFDTVSINGIIAHVSGGRAPFQYAISSTGSNTGFGVYQSSNIFSRPCPGQYWIRVIDSCGNIYTSVVTFSYSISYTTSCLNYSNGLLTVTASDGHPPYTYSIAGHTNSTGVFTNLPHYFNDHLYITDSCGVQVSNYYFDNDIYLSANCKFDSNFTFLQYDGPVTLICRNCNPTQTYVTPGYAYIGPVFSHLNLDSTYDIVATFTGNCGIDTMIVSYPPRNPQISYYPINCHTFGVQVSEFAGNLFPDVDSFVLSYQSNGTRIEADSSGIFSTYPNGSPLSSDTLYRVTAYINPGCGGDTLRVDVQLEFDNGICYILMKDSTCQTWWEVSVSANPGESFFIISSLSDTIHQSLGLNNFPEFYKIPPVSSYTLINNIGCSKTFTTPALPTLLGNISTSVACAGLPQINYHLAYNNFCNPDNVLEIFHNDTLVSSNFVFANSTVSTQVSEAGWYKYYLYISTGIVQALRYDTICPLDTGWVYVSNSNIPYPYQNFSYICNLSSHGDSVPYTIYGGSTPYTVEILGYDTVSLPTNNGIFLAPHPGNYTMLVYDNCGISRSYTFSVIDTCSPCSGLTSTNNAYDTICQGSAWIIGTNVYTQPGRYADTLMNRNGCDSIQILNLTVLPLDTPAVQITVSPGPMISGTETDTLTASYTDCMNARFYWYEDSTLLGVNGPVAIVNHPKSGNMTIRCAIRCQNVCGELQSASSSTILTDIADLTVIVQSLSIYPNPTQGSFTIEIRTSEAVSNNVEIIISDMLGQSIFSMPVSLHSGDNKEVISLNESTNAGVYIVQVTMAGESFYNRIVLDR